ncbi:unnamed protein product [Heligmosomoides polygyrus]|uniref:Uncharacterized protein n=1 Tax=Heligmosomoides polygyrus TaxID=6339 RepID=A0A183F9R1_HELPZ|nr:unnamed protein product [Heligmosomoides polygyrus]
MQGRQGDLAVDGDVKAKIRKKKSLYHAFLGDMTADNWQKYPEVKKAAKKAVAFAKALTTTMSTSRAMLSAIPSVASVYGPVYKTTAVEAEAALKKMKPGKTTDFVDLAAEMWEPKFWNSAEWLTNFFNQVV